MLYMEDTQVKPGLYAYQFRVDLNHENGMILVKKFMKHYDVKYHIVGKEVSDKNKEHFQCILWFEKKMNPTKLRNWWLNKTSNTKQPVSITSAKKIKNLAKYTMKDKNFETNLTIEEIKNIGNWKQKLKKVQWAEALDEHAKNFHEYNENGNPTAYLITGMKMDCGEYDEPHETQRGKLYAFIAYMLDFYKKNHKRPARASLQYLAWKHGYMSNVSLIKQWF